MRQKLCLAIFIVVSSALAVIAQTGSARAPATNPTSLLPLNPQLYGIKQWRVGESAEYQLILYRGSHKEVKRMRYAVLGEPMHLPIPYFTIESQVTGLDEDRHTTINSVTRPFGDLTNFFEGATGDFITKQDQTPAIKIPVHLLRERLMPSELQSTALKIQSVETLEEDVLVTPAGKFKTTHQKLLYPRGSVEVWWSGGVGPLGIVQAISRDFRLLLESRQEKHSVSAITEIPKPWPGR
ncbi:MAG: hypothetical protein PHX83_16045 [Acidobacteriia bacterium]|nr:hypothetical protein [Terriglobia bacterium]